MLFNVISMRYFLRAFSRDDAPFAQQRDNISCESLGIAEVVLHDYQDAVESTVIEKGEFVSDLFFCSYDMNRSCADGKHIQRKLIKGLTAGSTS